MSCKNEFADLKKGYWWMWESEDSPENYRKIISNLKIMNDSFNTNSSLYNGSVPTPYKCPNPKSCLGGIESPCAIGCHGPLCDVCSAGYYKRMQKCISCPSNTWMIVQLSVTALVLMIIMLLIVWTSKRKNKQDKSRRVMDIILARIKIFVGFYQVLYGVVDAFAYIKWPPSLSLVAKYSELVQINVLQIAPLHCMKSSLKVNAFGQMLGMMGLNAGAIVMALVVYGIRKIIIARKKEMQEEERAKAISRAKELVYTNLFFFLFVTYLSTCSSIVQVLPLACRAICRDQKGQKCSKFLKADYTINCEDSSYRRMAISAYASLAYVVGLPLISFFILYWNRKRNARKSSAAAAAAEEEEEEEEKEEPEIIKSLEFLFENYKENCWFWELVEMTRKLILTSGVILIGGESRAYVVSACFFSGYFGLLFAHQKPIKDPFENKLQLTSLAVTFANLAVGAISNVPKENLPADIDPYADSLVMDILVVTVNVLVMGLLAVQYAIFVFQNVREWRKNPKWSFTCCLALLVPLTNMQSDIRGLAGTNMLRKQLQTGKIGMPSIGATLKESAAINIAVKEEDDKESLPTRPRDDRKIKIDVDVHGASSSHEQEVEDTAL